MTDLVLFVPSRLMRGKHKSTPIEDIITEATKLAQKGIKESHANCSRPHLLWAGYLQKKSLSRIVRSLGKG